MKVGLRFIFVLITDILLHKSCASNNIVSCFSDDPWYDKYIRISPDLVLHWSVSDYLLFGSLRYEGIGWLSIGFSMDGSMIGSNAIVGHPDLAFEGKPSVSKFNLDSKLINGVVHMTPDEQTLINSTVYQDTNSTVLTFTKILNEENGEITISNSGKNIFLWAIGKSNTMGHHKASGSFDIDLANCNNDESLKEPILAAADGMSASSGYNKKAMLAHGLVGAMAWSFIAPVSIATASFRRSIPIKAWIFMHVMGNLSCYVLTLFSFVIAVVETSKNSQVSHFSRAHHITGLVIVILVTFQIMLGTARPPAQKEKNLKAIGQKENKEVETSCTSRAFWYTLHSTTGVVLLLLSMFQTFSGLSLFSEQFGERSILPFYWVLVIVYIFFYLIIRTSISIILIKR